MNEANIERASQEHIKTQADTHSHRATYTHFPIFTRKYSRREEDAEGYAMPHIPAAQHTQHMLFGVYFRLAIERGDRMLLDGLFLLGVSVCVDMWFRCQQHMRRTLDMQLWPDIFFMCVWCGVCCVMKVEFWVHRCCCCCCGCRACVYLECIDLEPGDQTEFALYCRSIACVTHCRALVMFSQGMQPRQSRVVHVLGVCGKVNKKPMHSNSDGFNINEFRSAGTLFLNFV